MHEYVRLCVECNRHSGSCPVKRLLVSSDLSSEVDRRKFVPSAPEEPSWLERPFRAPQRSRAGSSGHFVPQRSRAGSSGQFERPSGAERARAAISSGLERPFRAPQRSRPGSSGHFERPSRAERARAAISSAPAEPSGLEVGFDDSCGVSSSQTELSRALQDPKVQAPLRKFKNRYFYIYSFI